MRKEQGNKERKSERGLGRPIVTSLSFHNKYVKLW
jgi:hypothetical protein